MNVQNNNYQSFGMAYRMKGDAAKNIAKEIYAGFNPEALEKYFTNNIAKPLKELTTEVIADGDKVIIEHPVTKQEFEVLNTIPLFLRESNGREVIYPLKEVKYGQIGGEYVPYSIYYSKSQDKIGAPAWASLIYEGMLRKHIIALEVAKDMDKKSTKFAKGAYEALQKEKARIQETNINNTASKLQDLFG